MIVPRAIMTAAKIMRLRIYATPDQTSNIIMSAAKPRLGAHGKGGHFDEKDERRVNGCCGRLLQVDPPEPTVGSLAGSAKWNAQAPKQFIPQLNCRHSMHPCKPTE